MKQIVIRTDPGDKKKIEGLLEDTNYYVSRENGILKFSIFVTDDKLDGLIDQIISVVDLRYKERMIEVYSPDFIISSSLKRIEQKKPEPEKTPIEEIIDSVRPYERVDNKRILLVCIAGLVALTGLFMNNVAIIIGAMLLSPILGPIYALVINTTLGRRNNVMKNLIHVLLLLFLIIVLSVITTAILREFTGLNITEEIMLRSNVRGIYLLMAILLGLAAILAISCNVMEGLAGVAIAAALVPPAVATGILIVLEPSDALNSLIITIENVIGLITGGLMAALILDIVPRKYYERVSARKMTLRIIVILVVLIFIMSALIYYIP